MQAKQHQWVGIIANSSICMSSEESWIRIKKFRLEFIFLSLVKLDASVTTPMDMNYCEFVHYKYSLRSVDKNKEIQVRISIIFIAKELCFTDICWMRTQQPQWIRITANSSITNISLEESKLRIKGFPLEFLFLSLSEVTELLNSNGEFKIICQQFSDSLGLWNKNT